MTTTPREQPALPGLVPPPVGNPTDVPPADAIERLKPVQRAFELWRDYQRAPDRCKLTDVRRRLLQRALRAHDVEGICALISYAFEADTPEARFWRGGGPENREYLDLENLLVASKLDSRVERALAWKAGEDPHDPEGPQGDDAPARAPASPPAPVATQPVRGRTMQRRR
jgi:hypothetical protein